MNESIFYISGTTKTASNYLAIATGLFQKKGKVIIAKVVSNITEGSDLVGSGYAVDALMLNLSRGGRERTPKQWNENVWTTIRMFILLTYKNSESCKSQFGYSCYP